MNSSTSDTSFFAINIVVTRPTGPGDHLVRRLAKLGAEVAHFPVIEIQAQTITLPQNLEDFDWLIVISASSVHHGASVLAAARQAQLKIISIGPATSEALRDLGVSVDLQPADTSSEGILKELHKTDIAGQKFLIVRGNGGREHLATEITRQGGSVRYIEPYKRVLASSDQKLLKKTWQTHHPTVWIVTSVEGLRNLHQLVNRHHHQAMHQQTLLVLSARIASAARVLGWGEDIIISEQASNQGIVNCLKKRYPGA